MWRNLAGLLECLNCLLTIDRGRLTVDRRLPTTVHRPSSIVGGDSRPAQRQPLRIQRGVILGRLGKDFIRLRNGLSKSLLRGFPFPLPQSDDSVQGSCIVVVLWHIILKRGFDGGACIG